MALLGQTQSHSLCYRQRSAEGKTSATLPASACIQHLSYRHVLCISLNFCSEVEGSF